MVNRDHHSGEPGRGSGDQSRSGADRAGRRSGWRQKFAGGRTGYQVAFSWSQVGKGLFAAFLALGCLAMLLQVGRVPGCAKTGMLLASATQFDNCVVQPAAFAERDRNALKQIEGSFADRRTLEGRFSKADFIEALKKADASLLNSGKNSLLIMYLAAPAGDFLAAKPGSERVRTPCLLLSDSDPDEQTNLYSLDELWKSLKEQIGEKRHKLLFLDVAASQTNWRLGMLESWFVDDLQSQFKQKWQKEIPRLTIISSSGPGETSWGGATLNWGIANLDEARPGRSAFANALFAGLSGAAASKGGKTINVEELSNFVKAHACGWVLESRDLEQGQHPQYLGALDKPEKQVSISLSQFSSKADTGQAGKRSRKGRSSYERGNETADSLWDDRSERLHEKWRERETLAGSEKFPWDDATYQIDPLRWRLLTQQLLHAEEFFRVRDLDQCDALLRLATETLDELKKSQKEDVLARTSDQPFIKDLLSPITKSERSPPGVKGSDISPPGRSGKDETLAPPEHLNKWIDYLTAQEQEKKTGASRVRVFGELERKQDAVKLRQVAEVAALGWLGTHRLPTVKRLISQGDKQRRNAEDQMFIAYSPSIEKDQRASKEVYERARKIQHVFYQMWCTRNRLLADLPEFAVWAAQRSSASHEDREVIMNLFEKSFEMTRGLPTPNDWRALKTSKDAEEFEVQLLMLFRLARNFEQRLGKWDSPEEIPNQEIEDADSDLDSAKTLLREIGNWIDQKCGELLSNSIEQPQSTDWVKVDELLRCPALPPEKRKNLNERLMRYSYQIEQQRQNKSAEGHESHAKDRRPAQARWQGLCAILALSRGRPSETADSETADENRLWGIWQQLSKKQGDEFRDQITQLGDGIRNQFRENRILVDKVLSGGKTTSPPTIDGDQVLMKKAADRVVRNYFDLCDLQVLDQQFKNPCLELRKQDVEGLLLSQAQRYSDDYWADCDEQTPDKCWYERTVDQCLSAAKKLDVPALRESIQSQDVSLKKRKNAKVQIQADRADFGSRTQTDVPVQMTLSPGLPPGKAAVWLDGLYQTQLVLTKGTIPQPVEISEPNQSESSAHVIFALDKTNFREETQCPGCIVKAVPKVFFRGHTWNGAVDIDPCRPTGTREDYAAPAPKGSVVLDGRDDRVVLFVLDCSKSMMEKYNPRQERDSQTRFDMAKLTLINTLQKLRRPAERGLHQVGLIVYGNEGYGHRDFHPEVNPRKDIKTLREIAPLDQNHFQKLTQEIKNVQAKGVTPLFHAIQYACDELQYKAKRGGTIVVITDGVPTDPFPPWGSYPDKNEILRNVKELKARKSPIPVELRIVGFQIKLDSLKEEGEVHERAWYKELQDLYAALEDRGEFDSAANADELAKNIEESISGKYEIWSNDRRVEEARPFGKAFDLKPGKYELRFANDRIGFQIVGGESLKFRREAVDGRTSLNLNRPELKLSCRSSSSSGMSMGYQSFKVNPDSQARIVVSLANDALEKVLTRPKEIEFDVAPKRHSELPLSWKWKVEPSSLPTWAITIDQWPEGEHPIIKASWNMTRTPPDWRLSWSQIKDSSEKSPYLIEPPLSWEGKGSLKLKLLEASYDAEKTRRARFEVQIDNSNLDEISPLMLQELSKLRIEMQLKNRPTDDSVREFTYTRELYQKQGKLIVEIQFPADAEPAKLDDWNVLITSWRSRRTRKDSVQLLPPYLEIYQEDRQGGN